MTTDADIVMPKLGLTMTEGKVSRWAIGPGEAFTAGDVLVVVETDKIAFDVEATGAGSLSEIVVPEGETVAIGTPIARWVPSEYIPKNSPEQSVVAIPEVKSVSVDEQPMVPAQSNRGRIIATPYARRLARQSHLGLAALVPANGHRVTAADVQRTLAGQHETSSAAAVTSRTHKSRVLSAPGFSFYGVEICVDRLYEVIGDIKASFPELQPDLYHFVALAASRALSSKESIIAFEHSGSKRRCLPPDATRSLSTIINADRAEPALTDRPIALLIAEAEGVALVGSAPIDCAGVLGVGSPTRLFRPDGDGRPILRTQVSLVLTVGDGETLPNASGLLASIRKLLESPLILLAS